MTGTWSEVTSWVSPEWNTLDIVYPDNTGLYGAIPFIKQTLRAAGQGHQRKISGTKILLLLFPCVSLDGKSQLCPSPNTQALTLIWWHLRPSVWGKHLKIPHTDFNGQKTACSACSYSTCHRDNTQTYTKHQVCDFIPHTKADNKDSLLWRRGHFTQIQCP